MTRRIEGHVQELRCSICAATFPTFVFAGDTDMVTTGLAAATCCTGNEVALSEMEIAELRDESFGLHRFAQRISGALKREFRAIPLIRIEDRNSNLKGLSFQEFRRHYLPPLLVYSCPFCAGEAVVVGSKSPAEFAKKGGIISLVGDINLS